MIAVAPDSLCGGVTITPSQGFFTVNGKPVIRNGDIVLPHGLHTVQTVISARFFTCQGIPVTRAGDLATCGDSVATGEYPTIAS